MRVSFLRNPLFIIINLLLQELLILFHFSYTKTDTEHGSNMYMQGNATVQIGDKVSVKGSKATDMQSLAYVAVDEVQTVSTGNAVTYPEAEDITKTIDKYNSTDRTYISVSGVLDGNKINISGASYAASISDATGKLNISELNGHNVTAKGYFAGVAAPVVKLMATEDGKDTEITTLSHSFVKTDKMAWLHANVSLSGLTITAKTKITIRTKEWDAANKSQHRWFLDNIKLKKAK